MDLADKGLPGYSLVLRERLPFPVEPCSEGPERKETPWVETMNRYKPTTCVKLALLAISIILMAAAVFIGGGIIVAAYLLIMGGAGA